MKRTRYVSQSPYDLIAIDEDIDGNILIAHYKRTNVERISPTELEAFLHN